MDVTTGRYVADYDNFAGISIRSDTLENYRSMRTVISDVESRATSL